jgi:hypothetical protein
MNSGRRGVGAKRPCSPPEPENGNRRMKQNWLFLMISEIWFFSFEFLHLGGLGNSLISYKGVAPWFGSKNEPPGYYPILFVFPFKMYKHLGLSWI